MIDDTRKADDFNRASIINFNIFKIFSQFVELMLVLEHKEWGRRRGVEVASSFGRSSDRSWGVEERG